jgi:hypothetical protein
VSVIESTLRLRVDDSGFADKLKADAQAAKGLGASARDLANMKVAPGSAGLAKQLDALKASAGKIDAFRAANRSLTDLGNGLRASGVEAEKAGRALVAAQRRVDFFNRSKSAGSANFAAFEASGMVADARDRLKVAARAHTAAIRGNARLRADFEAQRTTVRALGSELERAGISLAGIDKTQASLRGKVTATTQAIHAQAQAHTEAQAAAATNTRTAGIRANAQLRATVLAGRMGRAEHEAAAAAEASRRRTAGRDMISGMGGAGRRQSDDIEGGRRLTAGMSRPGQDARHRAEVDAIARAEAKAEAAAARRQGQTALLGVGGLALGHKVREGTRETLHTYQEFDSERRFGGAVMGLTFEQQKELIEQAVHMGASSRFNDVQVLEAQRELAARGVGKDQVLGMIPAAKDLGQATDLSLPDAVKQLEGAIFGFKKDIHSVDAAALAARQTADVQVKAAKISGMTPDDIRQAYTYSATPARLAGISEEKMLAFAAIGKKSNMDGAQMGTAWRALIANATSPTRKAKETLRANGLNYSDYQRAPDKLDVNAFTGNVASSYGVKLSDVARSKLGAIFSNKELIRDASKFTPAVMDALGASLGKKDAKSKQSIAGLANRFRDASMKGVDVDRLVGDMMEKMVGNIAFSNALFGSKQGARIASAYGDPETYRKILKELIEHSEGYSADVSEKRMAGYDGAVKMRAGSEKNLQTSIGRALDDDGKGGALTAFTRGLANATQSLAELPSKVLGPAAVAAYAGGKAAEIGGTAALFGTATGLGTAFGTGNAAALSAAVTAGVVAGVPALAAALTVPLVMADKSKGIVHGGKNVGPAQLNPSDELPGLSGSTEAPSWVRRGGSLPPGTAGMPQPAPVRLPGLDGRQSQAPVAPQVTAAPKVDTSSLDAVAPKADSARAAVEGLNVTTRPTVDVGSIAAAEAAVDRLLAKLGSVGSIAASAAASANGALAGIRARASANPNSFSDGVTAGAGP